MKILKIREHREFVKEAAAWFHKHWGIPKEAYMESMEQCVSRSGGVPQWYMMMEDGRIIGGVGVIENDFHDRKDLAPNVCALYVEEDFRCRGIAGALLRFVCDDMADFGIDTLYLITDHTSFYERYGWSFLCMVQGDGEPEPTRMHVHTTDEKRRHI